MGQYSSIDHILMPWATRHGVNVATLDRDWECRSIWVYDRRGNSRAQIWLDPPDADGNVTLHASMLDQSSPNKEVRNANLATLEASLDELRALAFGWTGEGAFA